MENLPVTLIVKAPNQQYEDQTIKCELSWTIRKLKGYLSEVYPCNPSMEEQKLIYSGQLLNDAHILKDVLRQYEGQETHTVHLVFTPKNKTYHDASCKNETKPTPQARVEDATESRQRSFAGIAPASTPDYNATVMQSQSHSEQFALMQQMAMNNMTNQMYHMYLQYLNHYARSSQTDLNILTNERPNSAGNSQSRSQQPNPYSDIYQPVRQAQPQVQPAAQHFPDDDVENRDWLDILYTFSRLIVLLSLVYFYSSPGRCSIVILVMVLYYIYQNYQRSIRERQELENQRAAANENGIFNDEIPENEHPEENLPHTDETQPDSTRHQANENTIEGEIVSSPAPIGIEENNRLPTVTLLRTFVLSFFASLIPETPAL